MATEYDGIHLIARERTRQKTQEGWTDEHDDEHELGELSAAAFCYTLAAHAQVEELGVSLDVMFKDFTTKDDLWPWEPQWLKLSPDPIRNLVKAGALIAAEIDRLQRIPHRDEMNRQFREAVKRDQINSAKRILREAGETLD